MSDRRAALDMALRQIEKQFGKGSIMKLGESTHMQVEIIPSGSLALDIALGTGGLPRGRIIEVYELHLKGNRDTIRVRSVKSILYYLWRKLKQNELEGSQA